MANQDYQRFRVGEWLVEPSLGRLTRGGEQVSIRPKVMDLLVCLARKQNQVVSADDMIDELWAGAVVTSESVYFSINQLRKALGDDKSDPTYIETISKRGYRLIAAVETGVTGTPARGRSLLPRPAALAGLAGLAALLLLAVFGTGFFDGGVEPPLAVPGVPAKSIAVLPFVNMSSDPEQEYFSDGISEEILNVLAQVPDLQVAARTSSFLVQKQNLDISEIARQLKVSTVLEGSVRKFGNRIRISAQLINAADGFHIWSETYDRELDDLFAVQDEISRAIVGSLKEHLGLAGDPVAPAPRVATVTEAYDLYLQGRYHLNAVISPSLTVPRIEEAYIARDLFMAALEIAPDFAPAWAGLARATSWCGMGAEMGFEVNTDGGRAPVDPEKASQDIRKYTARAFELGPNLAEVQFVYGYFTDIDELELGLKHLTRAIEINPNMGEAHANLALTYEFLGQYGKAFDSADRAFRVDPLNGRAVRRAMYFYTLFRRTELLDDVLEASARTNTVVGHLKAEAFVRYQLGQFTEFPALEQRAREIEGLVESGPPVAERLIADVYLTLGLRDQAARLMKDQYPDTFLILDGRFGEAIEYLEAEAAIRLEHGSDQMDGKSGYRDRRTKGVYASLVHAYLYNGDHEKLLAFVDKLEKVNPATPPLPSLFYPPNPNLPWIETAYIQALFETGRGDEARGLLAKLAGVVEDRLAEGVDATDYHYELARLRAMQGRAGEALEALERAVGNGWRRWYFGLDPILAPLAALPGYAELKARYDQDIADMRKDVSDQLLRLAKTDSS